MNLRIVIRGICTMSMVMKRIHIQFKIPLLHMQIDAIEDFVFWGILCVLQLQR
jgi:hypothetical protein